MRCLTIAGVIAFALVLSAIPCAAQWQGNIPPGDYAQTCRNIQTDGNTLRAECQTRDGDWRRTSLDHLDQCGGGIINNDGHLQCGAGNGNGYGYPNRDRDNDNDRGYRGNWQGNVPPGDYVQTCRNIRANGNHLDAECQKTSGGWRRTSLDNIDQCSGGIINNNGRLQCGAGNGYGYPNRDRGYDNDNDRDRRGNWQGNLPPGDYAQTCRNVTANGNRLDAECQKRDGNWRRTSLDLDRCNSPIANDDGRLVCGR
jgi:hypothetical protein